MNGGATASSSDVSPRQTRSMTRRVTPEHEPLPLRSGRHRRLQRDLRARSHVPESDPDRVDCRIPRNMHLRQFRSGQPHVQTPARTALPWDDQTEGARRLWWQHRHQVDLGPLREHECRHGALHGWPWTPALHDLQRVPRRAGSPCSIERGRAQLDGARSSSPEAASFRHVLTGRLRPPDPRAPCLRKTALAKRKRTGSFSTRARRRRR